MGARGIDGPSWELPIGKGCAKELGAPIRFFRANTLWGDAAGRVQTGSTTSGIARGPGRSY